MINKLSMCARKYIIHQCFLTALQRTKKNLVHIMFDNSYDNDNQKVVGNM